MTFFCDIETHTRDGWIPGTAVYAVDLERKTIVAFDNVAFDKFNKYKNNVALLAMVDRFGPDAYWFHWSLDLPARGNKILAALYSVRLNTRSMRMTIRASAGDDASHRGTGRCKVQQGHHNLAS